MTYTVEYDGNTIDLPKYNLVIADKISKVDTAHTLKERCKLAYDTLKDLLGKDLLEGAIGQFKDVDPNDVIILFDAVKKSYTQPLEDAREELVRERLESSQIKELTTLVQALGAVNLDDLK